MKTISRPACPNCGKLLVQPVGNPKSPILLVGDYPDFEDVRTGRCLSGSLDDYRMNTRKVLYAEMVRVGIQLDNVRYTNLWQHAKDEKECKIDWHMDRVMSEIKGKSYVFLMGSDASRAIVGESSMDVAGLKFKLTAFPKVVFVVAPSPATLINGSIGDFRLALTRFKKEMK